MTPVRAQACAAAAAELSGNNGAAAAECAPWRQMVDEYTKGISTLDDLDTQFGGKDAAHALWNEACAHAQQHADHDAAPLWTTVLGTCLAEARGQVGEDRARAFSLFERAAATGFAHAQFLLGACYGDASGAYGAPTNYERAAQLYQLAADQGHADAQFRLGGYYALGYGGLPKSDDLAAPLIAKAIGAGHKWAQKLFAAQPAPAAAKAEVPSAPAQ